MKLKSKNGNDKSGNSIIGTDKLGRYIYISQPSDHGLQFVFRGLVGYIHFLENFQNINQMNV